MINMHVCEITVICILYTYTFIKVYIYGERQIVVLTKYSITYNKTKYQASFFFFIPSQL